MALRKTLKFLPEIFQTNVNDKFLSATLDQLISEPELKTVNGYIGRKFAPTYKAKDSYVTESTADRQNYQLEPSVVVRDEQSNITFFSSYIDLLNKIKYYGGLTNDHSRLFNNEFYSFDPGVSYDKLINFTQYYWLPNGPDSVGVNTSGVATEETYTVTRNAELGTYTFTDSTGLVSDRLTLARGGTYYFVVNQPGVPFWIQVEPGVDGKLNATPTISNRDVLGVTNNGIDVGTITFMVPQSDAQDRFLTMETVFNVDYATPFNSLPYSNLHNKLRSQFLDAYPQYAGITGNLDGKHLVFVDQTLATNFGEEAWTAQEVLDLDLNPVTGWGAGDVVPTNQRGGVWKIILVDIGIDDDPLIRLVPVQDIEVNEKVYVKYGIGNANREFYKESDGFLYRVPVISSVLDTLYYQDNVKTNMYGDLKIVEYAGWAIDVEADILGKKTYTSPNGITFTSGLKIEFGSDVTPAAYRNKQYYVEGVGDAIRLVDVTLLVTPELYNDELALNYPDQSFPDYITINRSALDLNAWSRNNRWFHRDVITATAEYNNTIPVFDQTLRAQRPIVQFEGDLQLYNYGRIGKRHIDVLDLTTTDAFNQLEGEILDVALGTTLFDGMRILFAVDNDPLVRNKIYVLNLVQYEEDTVGDPVLRIKLSIADDGENSEWDSVVVLQGQYKGSQWWFDGVNWNESQQKTGLNQDPLFEVFDDTGVSLSTYPRSSFAGTKIFGYKRPTTGVADSVLDFPLSYRNFGTQGDIEFQNYFDTDTFNYVIDQTSYTPHINTGFLVKIIDRDTVAHRNMWKTVVEESKQYQILSYTYSTSNTFVLDVQPDAGEASIPYLKIYVNNRRLNPANWEFDSVTNSVTINVILSADDKVDILVYSKQVSKRGSYEVPPNLDLNAQNVDIDSLTLGQLRNHLVALSQNSKELVGEVLAASNLRDLEVKSQGGNILQHSAGVPYASLFLLDDTANFVDAVRYTQREYFKFKNKFLELSASLSGIDPTDPAASVDLILTEMNKIKNSTFPWYYSDMVPYGPLKTIVADGYTVFDPTVRTYEITNVFNSQELSNKAVLVYLNDVQLVMGDDYTFDTDRPAITFNANLELAIDDIIKIVEYANTDGNYIPETPSKLGLYPKYVPEIFLDDTYRDPINVIRGHDGSLTPAFDDYRDNFILELEKRIYNNIKLPDTELPREIFNVIPGKFRDSDYTIDEFNSILSNSFLSWIGNNRLDYSSNETFESNDPFTWNYSRFIDRIDGESLPGSWRACFQYFYDTDSPHLRPWKMLGFSRKPDWWEDYYGPAPYTGGNTLLWDDLEAGRIVDGDRAGIDERFARPGLSQIIPVDENGGLISPAGILTKAFNSSNAATAWAVGNQGSVETAWRRSSDYPYAIQIAMALAKPAKYFGLFINAFNYSRNNDLGQYLTSDNHHLIQTSININGDRANGEIVRSAGYLNWIANYLTNMGINPVDKIGSMLTNFTVNLAYKMAGFSDQNYIQVLAEQSSPSSTNDSVVVPAENYKVHLYKSTPVDRINYSSVIVEKTTNGFTVRGYNLLNPYFTIIPSVVNSNATKIKVLNSEGVVYFDYKPIKLTVPYGYEFKNQQQVVDFLISYERFLIAQGFVFSEIDESLAEVRNFKLSVKEFLFWAQQGWTTGSVLVLSPAGENIRCNTSGAIVDAMQDDQYTTKVLDQNFKLVKNNNYNVMRTPTEFKLSLTNDQVIGFIDLNLVQYEHVLIFDNATVFNDIIYKPELGNRQYRLKLIGQKTDNWDGSLYAPGFLYNSGEVDAWQSGRDYLKGDLVEFKDQFYVALNNISAADEFKFIDWKLADYGQISKGLLSNFSSIAVKSQSYYDPYGYFNDADQIKYSHGLIGFKPRQYLDDLGVNETSQIEFYKGYIKQKGTPNAFDALTQAQFNNLASDINYFEEWAVRIGEYGAVDTNPYIEISLDEKAFSVNPATAEFVYGTRRNEGDGVTTFNSSQLYRLTDQYNGNIALNRDNNSDYSNDILTAGYVNIDDVDATIFDLSEFSTLNDRLDVIGNGYSIWVAKDYTQDWNVYRVTETDNDVIFLTNALDGFITFTTNLPHGLSVNDIFMVRNFNSAFDGFYQVTTVDDITRVTVAYSGDTTELSELNGRGTLFVLDSLRFDFMETARKYVPPHGWKEGEKIWIDLDAPTSFVQGQPYETGNNLWKVYEKRMPWNLKQQLNKGEEEYTANDGFGTSVKLSADGLIAVTGNPFASTTGTVSTFAKNATNDFIQTFTLSPDTGNVSEFGTSIDLSTDRIAVGAPGSNDDNGYVFVYKKLQDVASYDRAQILVGNLSATGDRFGFSVSLDEFGEWLYVGAPGNDRVYIYGLNKSVSEKEHVESVNNLNILSLSANITANIGDHITQPTTGADLVVTANVVNGSNVEVSALTNIVTGVSSGNIQIVNVNVYGDPIVITNVAIYPTATYTSSVRDSITLSFTPDVTDDANSLLVTSRERTYIPNVDYTLSGTTVTFSANIDQNDISIKQAPYYSLVSTVQGSTGSEFGYVVDSSYDGAQLGVGAPNETVNVGVRTDGVEVSIPVGVATPNIVSYTEYVGAGAVFVYDRVIEAFESTGNQDYTTNGTINAVHKVTIDNVEVPFSEYQTSFTNPSLANNVVRFITPPDVGKVVYVETNEINLLEKLIGIDSLEGGLAAIQSGARFGTSLTICSNNCAFYIGAPYYNNGTTYNTGAVWKFHSRGRLYGTNTGYAVDPTFAPNDTIRLDNFEVRVNLALSGNLSVNAGDFITQPSTGANVTVTESSDGNYIKISDYADANVFVVGSGNIYVNGADANLTVQSTSLDQFVSDINAANLLGITATNEGGKLRIDSDKTVAKNLLRILSGRNVSSNPQGVSNVYSAAELAVFAFMQIIINPYNSTNEYFGNKVILARNAYMLVIGSERGTTKKYTTFDDETTTLDSDSTAFFDSINGSGSVYIYELYDDPRDEVENPGRYAFAQQLNPGDLNTGDRFGAAVDIVGDTIIVSSPSDDTTLTDAGSVYIFENPARTRGWNLIRYQQPKVDVDSVNHIFLYNKNANTILTNLEFIDPAKGKIPGLAEQEIDYKTAYDPAKYNRGFNSRVAVNTELYWGEEQLGQVWWDLDRVRYVDYEQDSLTYRSINWGRLFPGSTIEVLEWAESDVLPSQYVETYPNQGVPKYQDDSAYVEVSYVDSLTNTIASKYYFWIGEKTSVDTVTLPNRRLPLTVISSLIENPKSAGVAYAAVIQNNAIILYNVGPYLSANDTILHLDYEVVKNNSIIHSEYELVQKGNASSRVPAKILNKMIDSLSGIDATGAVVPDPKLSVADRLGVGFRPRQSMFIDRLAAMNDLVKYVNGILIKKPVARQYDLTKLNSAEPMPNEKLGEYDQLVATEEALAYIDVTELPVGHRVLVETDTTQDNLWVLYTLNEDSEWDITRVQSYKTSLYWDYVDWYAEGYDSTIQVDYAVTTIIDALKLQAEPGTEILVRVELGETGGWNILVVNDQGGFDVVGIQNGTIQLKDSLGDFANNELGFSNQGFDGGRWDQNPNIEIRYIVQALSEDVFINELAEELNKTFFVMVNYLFGEQKYVDWIFKTSFISVTHSLRELSQFPNYIKDNQTYYQDYINEVKPYSTKVREYLVGYNSLDTFEGSVTDFDLPPYYDTDTKIFRSPSGEEVVKDQALWQTDTYNQWYQHRNNTVVDIIVEDGGSGYTDEPIITIIGGGSGVVAATARAVIDFDTGAVTNIIVTSPGSGYFVTPTVIVNGSSTVPARAYAVLENNQVRNINTTLKFDRITYSSSVVDWTANTSFTANTIVSYDGVGYRVNANITTGTSFNLDDYTRVSASEFNNANDRIMAYYTPSDTMPAKDLGQLLKGIDYPGVQVVGLNFDQQPGYDGAAGFDRILFDNVQYDEDGNPILGDSTVDSLISSLYTDSTLGTRAEDIDVDGGAYVDTYSSHAPEELIPGIVFDTLDMQVYTKVDSNVNVLGYRIFNNMVRNESFLRISDAFSTLLAQDLLITDTEIKVIDASKCPEPSPGTATPGVIFVGAERITYFARDLTTNTLSQLRRGTQGTGTPAVHAEFTKVVDGSLNQVVPGANKGNVTYTTTTSINATKSPSFKLKLTGNVTANVGDIITQATSGANVRVVGTDWVDSDAIWYVRNSNNPFEFTDIQLQFSSNITIFAGDVVTQESSSANLTVITTVYDTANVTLRYNSLEALDVNGGNLLINGIDSGYTAITVYADPISASNLAINGTYTVNVHPVSRIILGSVNQIGNVTVGANATLATTNIWYNAGNGTTTNTDGAGFDGATTEQVNFLREYPATYTIGIVSEDAVNILSTEDDEIIIEE